MARSMCKICGERPATVPDRERMGRLINRVCSACHALRLAGDMKRGDDLVGGKWRWVG